MPVDYDSQHVDPDPKTDQGIINLATDRLQRATEWVATSYSRMKDDLKFASADPDNGWQWPNYLWSQRRDDPAGYKPRLTINKARQHNLQIINDAKQNTPGIKMSPVGNEATFDAAQAWAGLVRDIERMSKAEQAYDTATSFQVKMGLGYIRVVSEYADDISFNQELRIRRVKNPFNVLLDPDVNEIDASDSNFGFAFEDRPILEFLRDHPEMKGKTAAAALGNSGSPLRDGQVRELEYYTRKLTRDRLIMMKNPEGGDVILARWSKIPPEVRRLLTPDLIIKERPITDHTIMWYKIAANEIIDDTIWPGKFIPIVPVIGEEEVIDGILDRKGHTRNLKDAQRMYNFWTSAAVEQVALQTKTKWFVPIGATDNLETYYATMNRQDYAFIPWHAFDQDGKPLPPPIPIEPPTMADGFIKGMMIAKDELGMTSGQREENFGQQTNAISGKAIDARQRQGDNATYHFVDGLAIAICQVGNIIVDAAPHIYDTKQLKRILGEDGTETMIRIDPTAPDAYKAVNKDEEGGVEAILNPTIGRYFVTVDVGPNYATRRQEAWNAFVQIVTQNQDLVKYIGDLMFLNADFPGADKVAERLRRIVPPEVRDGGPDAAMQAAQTQMKELQNTLAEVVQQIAEKDLQLRDKSASEETARYEAETKRLKEVGNAAMDLAPETLRPIVEQLVQEMLKDRNGAGAASGDGGAGGGADAAGGDGEAVGGPSGGQDGVGETPPVPGARKAADQQWYVDDPNNPGGFLRVDGAASA